MSPRIYGRDSESVREQAARVPRIADSNTMAALGNSGSECGVVTLVQANPRSLRDFNFFRQWRLLPRSVLSS
jgi:hypothetical protein